MNFDEFSRAEDQAQLLSYFTIERTQERVESIVIDFNHLEGRPVLEWYGGVLKITFDRTAEGQVQ